MDSKDEDEENSAQEEEVICGCQESDGHEESDGHQEDDGHEESDGSSDSDF